MTATGQDGGGQLALLPARAPEARRATLPLSELDGFEHAVPDRQLVEQIERLGLLQPLVVARSGKRPYRVIEGRRRAQAVAALAARGRWPRPARVDAVIMEHIDGDGVIPAGVMLALHASRRPSPASELDAIERILVHGSEQTQTIHPIASRTGMPVQTVRRRLRLRELIGPRRAFDYGQIPVSVAEAAARLTPEQQKRLDRLLAAGEPLTLPLIREIARARTAAAAATLPGGLFEDRRARWQMTVRKHLQAALGAIPADERQGVLAGAIADTITHVDAEGETISGRESSPPETTAATAAKDA